MKKLLSLLACFMLVMTTVVTPTFAAEENTVEATVTVYASVEDDGQKVSKVVIDYGEGVTVGEVTNETYTVQAVHTVDTIDIEDNMSFGEYNGNRTITKVEAEGSKVTIYLSLAEGGTLSYLYPAARNYPTTMTYTVVENTPVGLTGDSIKEGYTVTYTTAEGIVDPEVDKFESVISPDGLNYQFYKAEGADSLIVWFHGNGEGDYKASANNIAQITANRGGVAWASDEAQEIFGGAYVMAFQAPNMWYNAVNEGLLEKAYNEIQKVIEANKIDPEKVFVSGCSAGGYMTTRMIIAYPELFTAAMINCPALDVAEARGGTAVTDEELASIKESNTAIWLVQGETDATVQTKDCSQRMFNALVGDAEITETRVDQEIQSGYTTYETADGKYKMSLYDTTDTDKLMFAEDQDQDGTPTYVEFSNHWSWIYTLRNNPTDASSTTIWQWAANMAPAGSNSTMIIAGVAVVAAIAAVVFMKKKK